MKERKWCSRHNIWKLKSNDLDTRGTNFQNSLWECQYFGNVWLINLHGRKGLFMPVETKWQTKEIIMGEIECEIKMVNLLQRQIPRQSNIKVCIETWRQRYQKRMNPWLGRQGNCLTLGSWHFSLHIKKKKNSKYIQNNDPMWGRNKEKFENLPYFTLWFNLTSFSMRSEDLSRN